MDKDLGCISNGVLEEKGRGAMLGGAVGIPAAAARARVVFLDPPKEARAIIEVLPRQRGRGKHQATAQNVDEVGAAVRRLAILERRVEVTSVVVRAAAAAVELDKVVAAQRARSLAEAFAAAKAKVDLE